MTKWVSEIVQKPVDRFKNPKMVNTTIPQEERKNINSVHFTLSRTLPLTILHKKEEISYVRVY